jgi:signal recognition particle subunit SRP54
MFHRLSARLEEVFKRLRNRGILTESDVETALKDIRLALLEADVHFRVVKTFLERVRLKAIGVEVRESLTPGQQVVKIVWEELRDLIGDGASGNRPVPLSSAPPTYLMLVGLQGSGKTTTAAKLARRFKEEGRRVLLVAGDLKRPAAVEQLVHLGQQIGVEVHAPGQNIGRVDALATCLEAAERGRAGGFDLVIFDTAGRLHIDEELMEELSVLKDRIAPHERLLVVDAMTGQDAVQMAQRFQQVVGLTGVILTKLDGDARGGAMLSIKAVTGLPIKYIGTGEKLDSMEQFYPDRMASRVLGMGDVLSLIERAGEAFSKDQAVQLDEKWKSDGMTLEDLRDQFRSFKKLGSVDHVLGMLPGGGRLRDVMKGESGKKEQELVRMEAIIDSMTIEERRVPSLINGSRRRRIARGSGTTVQEINRLLRHFLEAKKLMKTLSRRQGKLGVTHLLKTF